MLNRGQTEQIGSVLLTAVIALTVSTTGAVVMSEWQANLDNGPVADIETNVTSTQITLEHRGGDTLYPQNTTIHLTGVDDDMQLKTQLQPGGSYTSEFTELEGSFELLIVYDPQETVVYKDTYAER